jgi:hypothetical protein
MVVAGTDATRGPLAASSRMAAVQDPPAMKRSKPPQLLIGRDGRGSWIVRDDRTSSGEQFASRVDALRFALFASGGRPQAVIMVPGVLER